ncbi:TetR/AcrR family transcriptional regulator [Frankia sp. AgB32]|uniref:TetR/AcrR family transcriptional regulator n=1 Tax=Frankia sp. AgB32 TaxID=631119 RepID=UPI00200BA361|nr:TetR/AcrR family transcriptional regulator [Frankia sp. AgB32]MCK9897807.1 TetR/AcrR family transcriptional regulator [Frankia sp. AgB32]
MSGVRGRPREGAIDARLLDAVRTLLASSDYAEVTIARISETAGVGRAAIYRRWSTRPELVFAAVVHGAELDVGRFDRGDLRADVHALVEHVVALLSAPVVRNALPGLLAELQAEPVLRHGFHARFITAELEVVAGILARARSRGELRPVHPIGTDEVHAHLVGMAWAEIFLVAGNTDDASTVVDRISRSVLSTLITTGADNAHSS